MRKFIEIENNIINLEEIMYICPQYDICCNIVEYHIVMKNEHYFILPNNEKSEDILYLIKDWGSDYFLR